MRELGREERRLTVGAALPDVRSHLLLDVLGAVVPPMSVEDQAHARQSEN